MLKEMIIKRTISYFFITFLSIFISINAYASEFYLNCTNQSNNFKTSYKINIAEKTIIHATSTSPRNNKTRNVNKSLDIISFEAPIAITMNRSSRDKNARIFKVFNFDKETYSLSSHFPGKKPSSHFYSCVKPDTGSAKWKKYATIQGNTYYFDPDFKDDGSGFLYVSELADFSKPNGWGNLSSKVSYEVECIMSVYRSVEFTYYKQRMGKGEGKSEKSESQDWKKALDYQRQYKLLEEACSASKRQ